MMKHLPTIFIGIVGLLVLGLYFFNGAAPALGGTTNLDTLELSEDLSVADDLSVTDALSVSGATALETLTQGGGITSTSTSGNAVPIQATDIDVENVVDVTLNVSDATLSFAASSTFSAIVPNAGDTRTIRVRNATTTPTMDITITGGTGMLLKKATTTAILFGDTDGANHVKLELLRKANTDIEIFATFFGD